MCKVWTRPRTDTDPPQFLDQRWPDWWQTVELQSAQGAYCVTVWFLAPRSYQCFIIWGLEPRAQLCSGSLKPGQTASPVNNTDTTVMIKLKTGEREKKNPKNWFLTPSSYEYCYNLLELTAQFWFSEARRLRFSLISP